MGKFYERWYLFLANVFLGGIVDRNVELKKYLQKSDIGIEIGPFHSPIAPKSEGWKTVVMDVFPEAELKKMAKSIPGISDEAVGKIEDVDIVGSAVDIFDLVSVAYPASCYSYIVSSHNFEHIPNPIRFLQGCSKLMAEEAYISMAIPDKRVCFDYFRSLTSTSQLIEAYVENRKQPTEAQIFDQNSLRCVYREGNSDLLGFSLDMSPSKIVPEKNIVIAYKEWMERLKSLDKSYIDTHCWTFTPSSFELAILDLNYLKLIDFVVKEVSEANYNEFYVHLVRSSHHNKNEEEYFAERMRLMRKISYEISQNSCEFVDEKAINNRKMVDSEYDNLLNKIDHILEILTKKIF